MRVTAADSKRPPAYRGRVGPGSETTPGSGSRLLLPLTRLDPESGPARPSRTLDLDPGELRPWLEAVRASDDACLVLDAEGRVAGVSERATTLLDLDDDALGHELAELVRAIDFSVAARPEDDQVRALPPLQALASGHAARGLLRLRHRDSALVTLDVVCSPVACGSGVVAFLQAV